MILIFTIVVTPYTLWIIQTDKCNFWVHVLIFLGLGWYGHQPYRYVFDTDLADTIRYVFDMIRIRYDTHVHDIRFQNLELRISTTNKCFGLIYTVNSTNTSSKTQWSIFSSPVILQCPASVRACARQQFL